MRCWIDEEADRLTKAEELKLKMPRLRTLPFETAIIQCYQKREISIEEALVEMYLAGVSVRCDRRAKIDPVQISRTPVSSFKKVSILFD